MNGILGFADLLKEPKLSGAEQQKYIGIIEKSGARMLNIINDLVNISKVESGQMDVVVTDTNINEQLEFLYSFFIEEAKQKGLDLILKCPLQHHQAFLHTDREKVYAIMTNLIKNALKFTKQGSVEFGYELKDISFEFYVKDTGIGIPEDKHLTIFDRFAQVDTELTNGYEGAGLGLSISKAYVEMLGGEIRIESELGRGAHFSFTLPFSNKPGSSEKTIKENYEPEYGDEDMNTTILIAEDDEESMMYLNIILEKSCCTLLLARNGKEAVELCHSHPEVDIVLMDIKMPIMDGHTAAKLIKQFNPDIPIIAQTAYALETEKEKYGNTFDEYFTKPIKGDELLLKIRMMMKKKLISE
jgi:CheY-like chemotaxis protein